MLLSTFEVWGLSTFRKLSTIGTPGDYGNSGDSGDFLATFMLLSWIAGAASVLIGGKMAEKRTENGKMTEN